MIPFDSNRTGLSEAERTKMGAEYVSPFFLNIPDTVLPEIGCVRVGYRPGRTYDPNPQHDLFDFLFDLFKGKR